MDEKWDFCEEMQVPCSQEQKHEYNSMFPVSLLQWEGGDLLQLKLEQELMRAWVTWFPPGSKFQTYGEFRQEADGQEEARGPKDGRTPDAREVAIGEYIKNRGARDRKITVRELAQELGCSERAAADTDVWKAYHKRWVKAYGNSRTRNGKGRRPLVARGDMEKLVNEQAYEDEKRRVREERLKGDQVDRIGPYDRI